MSEPRRAAQQQLTPVDERMRCFAARPSFRLSSMLAQ